MIWRKIPLPFLADVLIRPSIHPSIHRKEFFIFPYAKDIEVEPGLIVQAQDVLEHIWPLLTQERQQKITRVAQARNFNVAVVLENIYDRGNISAVMRSQEAFGFGRVDVIESGERFKNANRVSSGAEKWLYMRRWQHTTPCWKELKREGYKICVTTLQSSKPIDQVDWTVPVALVLGNEKDGVSQELLENADERFVIPMDGFVQSFNISVAGAISLYHIHQSLKATGKSPLTEEQIDLVRAIYALKTLDSAAAVLKARLNQRRR